MKTKIPAHLQPMTSAQRARMALEILAKNTSGNLGRNFSDCFEMGDGDAVIAAGLKELATSARYRAAVRRWAGITVWREFVATFDDPELRLCACGHPKFQHATQPGGAVRCKHFGCGCFDFDQETV